MYYINYFFLYSIIGHLIESIVYLFCKGHSGILYGFWTPVYGIGIVIILLIDKLLKRFKLNKFLYILILFLASSILLTISEFLGGVFIDRVFDMTLWNYESHKFNIGKYISLEMAVVWGVASLIFMFTLKPISDKIVKKIPRWLSWILIILMSIDFLITIFMKSKIFF